MNIFYSDIFVIFDKQFFKNDDTACVIDINIVEHFNRKNYKFSSYIGEFDDFDDDILSLIK